MGFPKFFGTQCPQEANVKDFIIFNHTISVYTTERTGGQWINQKLASQKEKNTLRKKFKTKLLCLANGKYKKQNLHL